MEKVTTDTIINWAKERVENRKPISRDEWLEMSFKLNVLILSAIEQLEELRQNVAIRKLDVMKGQEKRNVAAADLEIEATNEFKEMRIAEAKVEQIKEFIRIAKKNSDNL